MPELMDSVQQLMGIVATVVAAVVFVLTLQRRADASRAEDRVRFERLAERLAGSVATLSSQLATYNERLQLLQAQVREDLTSHARARDAMAREVSGMQVRLDGFDRRLTEIREDIARLTAAVHEVDVDVGAIRERTSGGRRAPG